MPEIACSRATHVQPSATVSKDCIAEARRRAAIVPVSGIAAARLFSWSCARERAASRHPPLRFCVRDFSLGTPPRDAARSLARWSVRSRAAAIGSVELTSQTPKPYARQTTQFRRAGRGDARRGPRAEAHRGVHRTGGDPHGCRADALLRAPHKAQGGPLGPPCASYQALLFYHGLHFSRLSPAR